MFEADYVDAPSTGALKAIYRIIPNISRTESPNLNDARIVLHLPLFNPLKPGVKSRIYVVGAAPTTSEWSTILFPTRVPLILEVWG